MRARKTCRVCKVEKYRDRRNFYRAVANRDGYKNVCKACESAAKVEYRELKAEVISAKRKAYEARPETKAWRRQWYKRYISTPRGREIVRACWRRYARFKRLQQIS